jgi:alpha-tubulin suppressor-like RCC1 family protein
MLGLLAAACGNGTEPEVAAVAVVQVAPAESVVVVGGSVRFTAVVQDAAGGLVSGRPVSWSALPTAVASISGDGLATGVAAGLATIRATVEGVSGTAQLTVVAVASVVVTPADTVIEVAGSVQLQAQALDNAGSPIPGSSIQWTSLEPSVATVSGSGLVTGVAEGSATIVATAGGVDGEAMVAVVQPVPPGPAPTDLLRIAAGAEHSCGLDENGFAYCWGREYLGDGVFLPAYYPVPVAGGRSFVSIDAGGFTCAVTGAGESYCWGTNDVGSLGDGTRTSSMFPVRAIGTYTKVATGDSHACGLDPAGAAWCWGWNGAGQAGQLPSPSVETPTPVGGNSTFLTIDAGSESTCAIDTSGDAWCWGSNAAGQLGDGSGGSSAIPVAVAGGSRLSAVSVGFDHACALDGNGQAACWGDNTYGQLGDGSTDPYPTPVQVAGDEAFVSIRAGFLRTCAITSSGELYCWGWDMVSGVASENALEPEFVPTSSPVAQIALGNNHNCLVLVTRQARCWGDGTSGKLGNGGLLDQPAPTEVLGRIPYAIGTPTPVAIPPFRATALGVGLWHSCAVRMDGIAHCWGDGDFYQLGQPFRRNSTVPLAVGYANGFVDVDAGEIFSCGVTGAGDAYCWGDDRYGRLGTGPGGSSGLVAGGRFFVEIDVGWRHACALTPQGEAYCWGDHTTGQLGTGSVAAPSTCNSTSACSPSPVPVAGGIEFRSLSAGQFHTCGLAVDDILYCWGSNNHGQLGIGTKTGPEVCTGVPSGPPPYCSTSPVAVGSEGDYVRVAAALGDHTCALTEQGSAECWGENTDLQLGNPTNTDALLPTPVVGTEAWIDIAGANRTTCALRQDGRAFCWGALVSFGQVATVSSTPVTLSGGGVYTKIAVGTSHACAMAETGAVTCWGNHVSAQLGDGVTPPGGDWGPVPVWGLGRPDLSR